MKIEEEANTIKSIESFVNSDSFINNYEITPKINNGCIAFEFRNK